MKPGLEKKMIHYQASGAAAVNVMELTDSDIDAIAGGDFWGSVATGAGAGAFAGAFVGPVGAAVGALAGGTLAAILYFD